MQFTVNGTGYTIFSFLVRVADLKKPIEFRLTELTDETLIVEVTCLTYRSIELGGCETQPEYDQGFLRCIMWVSI